MPRRPAGRGTARRAARRLRLSVAPFGAAGFPGSRVTYDQAVSRQVWVALYVLTLVALVVGVDVLFFRNHFWERLMANVGIVLVFGAFALRFRHALGGK